MKWLSKLSLTQKFATVVAMLIVPIAMLAWFFGKAQMESIDASKLELSGIHVLAAANDLQQLITERRSLQTHAIAGDASATQALVQNGAAIDATLKLIDDQAAANPAMRSVRGRPIFFIRWSCFNGGLPVGR